MTLTKDQSILDLITLLRLEDRGWVVVDHWEGDLCAVGIATQENAEPLVYVSTYDKRPGHYDYECEVSEEVVPANCRVAKSGANVNFAELLTVLERHL